jgi:23S rRNA pseudouridine1911/1915/1917 synthase
MWTPPFRYSASSIQHSRAELSAPPGPDARRRSLRYTPAMDLVVPADTPAMRVDRFLARCLPAASRRAVRMLAEALRINGRRVRRSAIVRPGDVITVPDALATAPAAEANSALRVEVLYEDADLVAVDKPAGISSVAVRGGSADTVASFLAARFPETRGVGGSPLEAGLVHRLDRETSGVLLAARTPAAYAGLRRQFTRRRVRKEYLALVAGDVARPATIRTPIAHDRRHPARMRVAPDPQSQEQLRARPAETAYRPEIRYGAATLLRVIIHTGVRHQIRVHLASIGHPIVGDRVYGAPALVATPSRQLRLESSARHALHACRIEFRHPASGAALVVESPLPADFEELLRRYTGRTEDLPPRRRKKP